MWVDEWNRIASLETESHILGNLVLARGAFKIRDEKILLEQCVFCVEKNDILMPPTNQF